MKACLFAICKLRIRLRTSESNRFDLPYERWLYSNNLRNVAGPVGLEPTPYELTARCSTLPLQTNLFSSPTRGRT